MRRLKLGCKDLRKSPFTRCLPGSPANTLIDLGLVTSRTVKQYISVVYTTQSVALCYSSSTKLICHSSLIFCLLASTPIMPMKCFPLGHDLFSGHSAHRTYSFGSVDHPSLNFSLLLLSNIVFTSIPEYSFSFYSLSCH